MADCSLAGDGPILCIVETAIGTDGYHGGFRQASIQVLLDAKSWRWEVGLAGQVSLHLVQVEGG